MHSLNEYMYTVWFRDHNADVEDQDYEFPVCIIIKAQNDVMAKEWGDKISKKYTRNNPENELLRSEISNLKDYSDSDLTNVPVINYGYEPTDQEIGL